jgi:hypothetical protein
VITVRLSEKIKGIFVDLSPGGLLYFPFFQIDFSHIFLLLKECSNETNQNINKGKKRDETEKRYFIGFVILFVCRARVTTRKEQKVCVVL